MAQRPAKNLSFKLLEGLGGEESLDVQARRSLPTSMPSFDEIVGSDRVVLFDGAMGTQLYALGAFINRPFEELNLTDPDIVREVHRAYIDAGADVIETNTFAANRFRLSSHGLADRVSEINASAVSIARQAAGDSNWVAGALGPLGVRIEPFGAISKDEAEAVFAEQAAALCQGDGVDLFCLETFVHLPELVAAITAVRSVSKRPILAQIQFAGGGVTREGVTADEVAAAVEAAGADIIGVNCLDALGSLQAIAELCEFSSLPVSGQPNAGVPRSVEGRKLYMGSPEYFVAWARRAMKSGARLLGGCCGTTPDHIRALRSVVSEAPPTMRRTRVGARNIEAARSEGAAEPVATAHKSVLAAALSRGDFVSGIQLQPPRGWVPDEVIERARKLALAGVDYMSVPEGPPHGAYLPPLVQAHLARQVGLGAVIWYSCRGRRLARMQSDLLGAAATGVANLMLVTGDPLSPSATPESWRDLEIDSIGLVNLAAGLNRGEDLGTNAIGRPTEFHLGVHIDPSAPDLEKEQSRFFWKVDAGAEYALTSPIFDAQVLVKCLETLKPTIPIIATIWPLANARSAEFFEHEMATVPVPAPLVERMRQAEEAGNEAAEGLAIAVELAEAVRPFVQGIEVVAPDGRLDIALAVVEALRRP